MGRKVRLYLENTPQHILLKAVEGLKLYKDEEDYIKFMEMLLKANSKAEIKIHSYILNPSFFEFLATPLNSKSITRFLQILGRNYVRFYNKKYNRNGTIWQGRYKSSIVQNRYVLPVMKYIESFCKESLKYCSIKRNLFNENDDIITPHPLYLSLGKDSKERAKNYKSFFFKPFAEKERLFIKECIEKQLVTGTTEYIKKLEKITNIALLARKRGRPRKKIERIGMYKKLVILTKEAHKNLKVKPIANFNFAKEITYSPIMAKEIKLVANDFPVVFSGGETPQLVAIYSLTKKNMAIDEFGNWQKKYIPMYFRQYPFALLESEKINAILIDEESELVSEKEGSPLFENNGEYSPYLTKVAKYLSLYKANEDLTKKIVNTIDKENILEERTISIDVDNQKREMIKGFKVINEEKLKQLDDATLAKWAREGILEFIYNHIYSLSNIKKLLQSIM